MASNLNETLSGTAYLNSDQSLRTIYERFGRVILVPLDKQSGKPIEGDGTNITFEKTQKASYLRILSISNIAVMCGKESGNLCGIRFHNEQTANEFIQANTALAKTLMTVGPQGTVFWLRCRDWYPVSQKVSTGLWLAARELVIVHNRDGFGTPCKVVNEGRPVEVDFDDITWNPADKAELMPQIVASRFGPPFIPDKRNELCANHNYWAYLFCVESGLVFHPGQQQFLRWDDERGLVPVQVEFILNEMRAFLFVAAQRPGFKMLEHSLSDRELRLMLKHMRIVAASKIAMEQDGLEAFLSEEVAPSPGATVTVEELFAAYSCYSRNHRVPALTRHEFQRQSPEAIRRKFGVSPAHSIKRGQTQLRGFYNLALRALEAVAGTVGTVGTPAFAG